VKYTKRYRLGQLLSTITRHFLLMTATPHNGKDEDFQLFMALLDGDRFEGKFRDGVHAADVSDLMRRMVKENLLKFDATPLFPERIANTVPYKLSDGEAQLYKAVTDYVRQEFNRAEALENNGRAGTVGFALTILQRRLAGARTTRLAPCSQSTNGTVAMAIISSVTGLKPLRDKQVADDRALSSQARFRITSWSAIHWRKRPYSFWLRLIHRICSPVFSMSATST
jgi:hypothetical protein